MDVLDAIELRRSIRGFTSQPVEAEKLQKILEAANLAPSAGNLQSYEIYVVTDAKKRDGLSCASMAQDFLLQSPVVLAFCTDPARAQSYFTERGINLFTIQDATIACSFAMLAAVSLGLGCVWVGTLDEKAVRAILGAPDGQIPVVLLPIGYPDYEPEPRERRPLDEIVHWVGEKID
jgi:nitroreductase